jgi:hypothetical protein
VLEETVRNLKSREKDVSFNAKRLLSTIRKKLKNDKKAINKLDKDFNINKHHWKNKTFLSRSEISLI